MICNIRSSSPRGIALLASLVLLPALASAGEAETRTANALEKAISGDQRSAEHKARDRYRHPAETLEFMGIRGDMTVVELSPGGGWYTEILAPLLRDHGKFYAAAYDPNSKETYYRKSAKKFATKLADSPAQYDKVSITILEIPAKLAIAPDAAADMVLTFRNLHNWINEDQADRVLSAAFKALKPGGVFGIVQHRGDSAVKQDPEADSGYVNQDYAVAMIEAVGFKFVDSSEINANPADTRDHPKGVWTLPPGFALEDVDRAKYEAIGESDRMTLKFVKPANPSK